MYKLFLCLRYLLRKALAYAAMVSVTLCVALMLIVVSVMNGFLDKIEFAAKGLFGDIIVDADSQHGIALYDEFIAQVRKDVPEVEAGSPFILSYGILRIKSDSSYRQAVQIAGIRLPDRVDVSEFEKGLFTQAGMDRPTFDPDVQLLSKRLAEEAKRLEAVRKREAGAEGDGTKALSRKELLEHLDFAIGQLRLHSLALEDKVDFQAELRKKFLRVPALRRAGPDKEEEASLAEDEMNEFAKENGLLSLRSRMGPILENSQIRSPDQRVILGLGIQALTIRTGEGETIRLLVPCQQVVLFVFPLGRMTRSDLTPNSKPFMIVDDCQTDVSSIDSQFVYVPFDTLQRLNNMDQPNRCSQIHFKVRPGLRDELALRDVSQRIQETWYRFRDGPRWKKLLAEYPEMAGRNLTAVTWRQRQARILAPIEAQRTLVITMFGVISLVALVLIFVIFYMIVVQKTRDIGVLKSVGASRGGVAGIFLAYGAAVGLVGSIFGTILGWIFVHNINPIHDFIGETTGMTIWSREWFLFEKIPNQVSFGNALIIMASAILAGVLGALIPALKAARMQPVEALRYE